MSFKCNNVSSFTDILNLKDVKRHITYNRSKKDLRKFINFETFKNRQEKFLKLIKRHEE